MTHIDGNSNPITVEKTGLRYDGRELVIARMQGNPNEGYIALDEGGGSFGDETCHSSYKMSCMGWFGPEEIWPDADTGLLALMGLGE